jgi:hypothetical protein
MVEKFDEFICSTDIVASFQQEAMHSSCRRKDRSSTQQASGSRDAFDSKIQSAGRGDGFGDTSA